jgi:hypothetical protein
MRDSSRGYKAVQCSALQLTGQVGVLVRCVCHHPAAPLALLQTGQVGRGSSSIASSGAAGSARRARLATRSLPPPPPQQQRLAAPRAPTLQRLPAPPCWSPAPAALASCPWPRSQPAAGLPAWAAVALFRSALEPLPPALLSSTREVQSSVHLAEGKEESDWRHAAASGAASPLRHPMQPSSCQAVGPSALHSWTAAGSGAPYGSVLGAAGFSPHTTRPPQQHDTAASAATAAAVMPWELREEFLRERVEHGRSLLAKSEAHRGAPDLQARQGLVRRWAALGLPARALAAACSDTRLRALARWVVLPPALCSTLWSAWIVLCLCTAASSTPAASAARGSQSGSSCRCVAAALPKQRLQCKPCCSAAGKDAAPASHHTLA